jgi:hypothetical protein
MRNQVLLSADALDLNRGAATPVVNELQSYLSRFGWLRLPGQEPSVAIHDELPEAEAGHFDDATETALTEFQRFYHLPVEGRLNAETLALIRSPRCGVPDRPPAVRGPDGFVAASTKWDNVHLGRNLSKSTSDQSDGNVNQAVKVAYRRWCLVARMEVHQVSSNADIDVRFETGNHGDGNAFDGVGNVLAHAFYPPPNGGAIAGDLHFDDAETWTRDLPPTGIDLDTVALHEAGHTLGLDHSADAAAVMFAFYGGSRRILTDDDIAGIRSVYGERRRNLWTDIDTAVEGDGPFAGKAYLFRGADYLRYDYGDDLPDPGYAKPIAGNWPGLPAGFTANLDAMVNGQQQFAGKLYIFKGSEYVRYDWAADRTDPGYPKPIAANWPGLPAGFTSDFDAAVTGKGPFAGKAYFFKGSEYVRYDWAADRTDPGYPKPIAANWPGLPAGFTSNIQAAINGQKSFEGKAYLFKGADYARYDWAADHGDPGYPLPIEFNWL